MSGAWDYCSGCDVATHFLGASLIMDPVTQTPSGVGYFLFDRAHYRIIDNWNVMGMQGTGSRRVVVEDRFVPAYRMLPMTETRMQEIGQDSGSAFCGNPLYQGVPLAVYEFALYAVAVGVARGALDLYEKILREKKWILPPFPVRFEMPELQQRFGDAQALIDTAETALAGLADQYTGGCRRAFAAKEARRIHRAGGQCLELAWQAVDLMFRTGGSSSAAKSSPLGRCFRNLAIIRTHIGAQRDHTSINVARMHFGLAPLSPL